MDFELNLSSLFWILRCLVMTTIRQVSVAMASLIGLAFSAFAVTNEWYPGASGFTGWPTNWVSIPSLNDPKELSEANVRIDFVGDTLNPGAYWSANSNYFFIRMRVAVSNVTSTTFRDAHWIYIDRVGYTNGNSVAGAPDYAIAWDSKNNDVTKHGLELGTGTNLTATTFWSQLALSDLDSNSNDKIAPPDFNLAGDGYIRTIDMCPTTNFGYTTFIDFAVKWSFLSSRTFLGENQEWRLQFGSRNDANDHNFPQDDIAGGYSPASVVTNSYSSAVISRPLSSALDLSVYATASGVFAELWTVNEAGNGDIEIFALLGADWVEVGRLQGSELKGEGSNSYFVPLQGLVEGKAYFFKVVDEVGHVHCSPEPVIVGAMRMAALRMSVNMATLIFDTVERRRYVVKTSTDLLHWSNEYVSYPMTSNNWSELVNTPFTAGPGTQTEVRVPINGRQRAFFRIERLAD